MADTSLTVKSVQTDGKKRSKTIGYVNPSATNEQLQQTAALFNALSTNTYEGGTRTEKTNINDPTPAGGKIEPTLTATPSGAQIVTQKDYNITYDGDGQLFYRMNDGGDGLINLTQFQESTGEITIRFTRNGTGTTDIFTGHSFQVHAAEGDTYAAKTIQIDWT